jgi:urease accessory protein
LEIRCGDPLHLARIAWHLGNRHLPTQLFPKSLRIRRDHVIAEMAAKLGARVIEIEGPFDPEGGAYETPAHAHGHDHSPHDHHDHDHHHGHSHGHRHGG